MLDLLKNDVPDMTGFTGIGRLLDPRYPFHAAIIALSLLGGAIAGTTTLLTGETLIAAVLAGLAAGGATFLAWVIARELDPDAEAGAFVAAVFTLIAALALPITTAFIAVLASVPMWLRVVNRTTGVPAYVFDLLGLSGVVLFSLFAAQAWPIAVAAIVGLLMDGLLLPKANRRSLFAAGALVVVVGAYAATVGLGPLGFVTNPLWLGVVGAASLSALVAIALMPGISATGDAPGAPPTAQVRVRAAIAVVLLAAGVSLLQGDAAFASYATLWATLLASGLVVLAGRARLLPRIGDA